jgi:hypothetical protein
MRATNRQQQVQQPDNNLWNKFSNMFRTTLKYLSIVEVFKNELVSCSYMLFSVFMMIAEQDLRTAVNCFEVHLHSK